MADFKASTNKSCTNLHSTFLQASIYAEKSQMLLRCLAFSFQSEKQQISFINQNRNSSLLNQIFFFCSQRVSERIQFNPFESTRRLNIRIKSLQNIPSIKQLPMQAMRQKQKYVFKMYRNCSNQQLLVLSAENTVLQYLAKQQEQNNQSRFPMPVKRHQRQFSTSSNVQNNSGQLLCTDKNIVYNLQNQVLQLPQIASHNKYIAKVNIQIDNNDVQQVYVRVLEYIEGEMLGALIQNAANNINIKNKSKLQQLILRQMPKFIAKNIDIPLSYYKNTPNKTHYERFTNRKFQWLIGSFISQQQYYKQRHGLMYRNTNRSAEQTEIIKYFIQLYSQVLSKVQEAGSQSLRTSLIHNDLNQWNIVINKFETQKQGDKMISVIDFDDMVETYLIQEIAVYSLYAIYTCPIQEQVKKRLNSIIYNYTRVLPITEYQLMLYFISVPTTMCLSLCNSQYALSKRPEYQYVAMSQKNGWKLLQLLKYMFNKISVQQQTPRINKIFCSQLYVQLARSAVLCDKNSKQYNIINHASNKKSSLNFFKWHVYDQNSQASQN